MIGVDQSHIHTEGRSTWWDLP